ncbi:translation initiation factor IF-3 [Candidatus Haliotispira prima]|uniref:Translation initiation factor IF-3 n=1 Tax=Candidatus Haliotispira prima TaxID=3034016 RepID=A0ABY8MKD2_9SPIO|nr:translation initiation factor IF-3 [Candidatus Haliotispira prima]
MKKKDLATNRQIKAQEVFLIDPQEEKIGAVPLRQALQQAEQLGLDLVEVSPLAKPPVCKIMDYGKFKFEQEKRQREQKRHQHQTKLKEIRMQPKIDEHDIVFKTRQIQQFLEEGSKVKVTVRFRGRELAHTEYLGDNVLNKVLAHLEEGSYNIDSRPKMEGRLLSMMLSAKKSGVKKT